MKINKWILIVVVFIVSACGQIAHDFKHMDSVDNDVSVDEESIELGHPGSEVENTSITPQAVTSTSIFISRFELYNTNTGALLRTLSNGAVIDLGKDGSKLTIRARVGGTGFESVRFQLDGQSSTFVDNSSPFALAGNNSNRTYKPATFALGSHILKATPYTENYAGGLAGTSSQLSFSVINSSSSPLPTPTPAPTPLPLASFRSDVARLAQAEADLGLCGTSATSRYQATTGSAWCSEFARWVFIKAAVMDDSVSALWAILSWNRFETFFVSKGMFLSRAQITKDISYHNNMVGNYLLLDTDLDGLPNHSALIVGVSSDLTKLYTVEGNVSDCTRRVTRNFWVSGVLDAKIKGIGQIWP